MQAAMNQSADAIHFQRLVEAGLEKAKMYYI